MMDGNKPPRRYSRTSFYICIGLAVLYLMLFAQAVASVNYYEHNNWPAYLLVCIVFAVIAALIKRRNDKADAACDALELEQLETQRLLREKLLREEAEREYRHSRWAEEDRAKDRDGKE